MNHSTVLKYRCPYERHRNNNITLKCNVLVNVKMKTEIKRLFISNLQSNISDEDLRKKFSDYGNVLSVEIKERKNPVDNQTQHFAYININTEETTLRNCIEEFARKKWKGQFLNLQLAKESFIDRLKREQNNVEDSQNVINSSMEIKHLKINTNQYPHQHVQNVSAKQTKPFISEDVHCTTNKDNEKRLKSLMHMKEGYRQQKLQIKNALLNIDKTGGENKKNKIRFDHSEDLDQLVKPKNSVDNRMQLFNEEDEDNADFDLIEQPQFDGVKGQKLMQLQSRFRNDERFRLDSRFLDDDQEQHVEESDVLLSEKDKQLEILESVLGQSFKRQSSSKEASVLKKPKMMLHFDPSQPQHSKFEVQNEIRKEVKPKKKDKKVPVKIHKEQSHPEVSKDTFYKVTGNLQNAFEEGQSFSLGKLFSSRIEQDAEEIKNEEQFPKPTKLVQKKQLGPSQKVFKYDSSDDEEKQEDNIPKPEAEAKEVNHNENSGLQIKPRMWTESFFFKDDDYRLQEGFDFIKRLQLGEQENFSIVRRNLKQIVRAKVKNNLRKNNPFRRKLGGNKKRIKVKRALKR